MFEESDAVSRRSVLKATAGAVPVAGAGLASAAGDEVNATYNVGYSAASGRAAARGVATEVVREYSFDALTVRLPERAAAGLRDRPDVRYVEEDGTMRALEQTLPWGVDRIDADVVHAHGETGEGAHVGIVDTGIDSDHFDLLDNLGTGKAFVSCGASCQCDSSTFCGGGNDNLCVEPWDDDNDHGTHVAGIAAAEDDTNGVVGVSPTATLHAVKVLGPSGCGSWSDVAAGIEHVADQGWDVANMSLGGEKSSVVEDAVEYAAGKGVLLVAAAGNSGPCSDCVSYPASDPDVVAVSATTTGDDLASFSSTGPEVEVAAPGEDVTSTVPGGVATFSGTSMASPHVASTGGQLMANGNTASEARDRLGATAEDIGLADEESGHGLVDTEAALAGRPMAVSTDAATDVAATTVTLNGTLEDLGGGDTADVYFEWGESGAGLPNTTSAATMDVAGSFAESLSGLDDGATYEFRAVADASDGDSDAGVVRTVTTEDVEVETREATNVGSNSATLNGELLAMGDADSATVYFEWGENDLSNETTHMNLTSPDTFGIFVDEFQPETTYSFRAVAEASDGDTDLGGTRSFTTDSCCTF